MLKSVQRLQSSRVKSKSLPILGWIGLITTVLIGSPLHARDTIRAGQPTPSQIAPTKETVPQTATERGDASNEKNIEAPQAPIADPRNSTGEFEPVLHARKAEITTCMDSVVRQSQRVIDSRHSALSVWNTKAPDKGLFQSIVALKYDNKVAPNGIVIVSALPDVDNRCIGTYTQIYPTALSCGAIQADLIKSGKTIGTLQKNPVVATSDGAKEVLIPTAGGGCVIITTNIQ